MAEATVLLAIPDEAPAHGGNAVSARRLASGLRALGQPAEVVPAGHVARRVAAGDVTLIHAFHLLKAGKSAALAAKSARLPLVLTCTGTDLTQYAQTAAVRREIAGVLLHAGAVGVLHPGMARAVAELWPEAAERCRVVWPGVVAPRGAPDRARWGLPEEAFVFLLPSGLRAVKRPAYAILPLERVRRAARRDVVLVLAGARLEEAVAREVEELAAARPWCRLVGEVAHEAMGSLFASSDVVLNTSESEGMSNAVLEAMALGLPVLAADNEGNRQAVTDDDGRQVALLFRDEEEFCRQALELVQDDEERRRLGAAAADAARRRFDPVREAATYLDLYRSLWAEGGRGDARREAAR